MHNDNQINGGTKQRDYVQTSMPRLTASSVNDLNCAYRYRKLRILKEWPSREAHAGQAHGEATHEVLREVYNRQTDGKPDLSQVDLLARTAVFRARYPRDVDKYEAIQNVVNAVEGFVKSDTPERVAATVANERFVEVPISHGGRPMYMLSTKLDRVVIDKDANQLRVIDYKLTANRGIDLKAALIMLWTAKLTYPGFGSYMIEYIFQDNEGEIESMEVHDYDLKGIYKLVTEQAREVLTATEFPTRQGDWCTFCVLRQSCPSFAVEVVEDDEGLF